MAPIPSHPQHFFALTAALLNHLAYGTRKRTYCANRLAIVVLFSANMWSNHRGDSEEGRRR